MNVFHPLSSSFCASQQRIGLNVLVIHVSCLGLPVFFVVNFCLQGHFRYPAVRHKSGSLFGQIWEEAEQFSAFLFLVPTQSTLTEVFFLASNIGFVLFAIGFFVSRFGSFHLCLSFSSKKRNVIFPLYVIWPSIISANLVPWLTSRLGFPHFRFRSFAFSLVCFKKFFQKLVPVVGMFFFFGGVLFALICLQERCERVPCGFCVSRECCSR